MFAGFVQLGDTFQGGVIALDSANHPVAPAPPPSYAVWGLRGRFDDGSRPGRGRGLDRWIMRGRLWGPRSLQDELHDVSRCFGSTKATAGPGTGSWGVSEDPFRSARSSCAVAANRAA